MEVALGFFGKRSKAKGTTVAVCRDAGRFAIAGALRGAGNLPVLQFATALPATSNDEYLSSLEQLAQQQKIHEQSTVAVLPPNSYQLIQIEMADLPEDERRDAARWQIRERIDYSVEEAIIDLFDVPSFGVTKKPHTYVVSAPQKMLREQIKVIEDANMTLEAIDIPEFALRNICDLFVTDDRGLALLLLLDHRGVLVIVRDGVMYLVRWLNQGMDALIPYAEGNLEALTEKLDTIVLEVQRSFDYCESTFNLPQVSRLLVAQTKQEIPVVTSYLNDYLTTKVETLSFADVLTVPDSSEQIELNQLLFAIGGALRQENNDAPTN